MTQVEAHRITLEARSHMESAAQALICPSLDTIRESTWRMESAAAILETLSTSVRIGDRKVIGDLSAIRRTASQISLLLRQSIDLRGGWMSMEEYTGRGDTRTDLPEHRIIAEG